MAQCPAHEDGSPSLSIRREAGVNGEVVLVHCFAGCDTGDVLRELGLGFADLFESSADRDYRSPRRAWGGGMT
jgi:putative DNA primase/helicase